MRGTATAIPFRVACRKQVKRSVPRLHKRLLSLSLPPDHSPYSEVVQAKMKAEGKKQKLVLSHTLNATAYSINVGYYH